jgi:hypothetical protein
MAEGILAKLLSFGRVASQNEPDQLLPGLPDGLTAEKFCERCDKARPSSYASVVQQALRYYRGLAQDDTMWALRRAFPKSADYMTPVSVPIVKYVINKQATVFSGEPDFHLADATGNPVEDSRWDKLITKVELQRHLQQANRMTRLCKRSFVRVTWSPRRGCPRLTTFTPDNVHVLFPPDATELNDALGVLLDLSPAIVNDVHVKRWEFWSAGENPRNFIIDAQGTISGVPDESGTPQFDNPYRDDAGHPIIPIVSFADEDVSVGYWLIPDLSLIAAQQAIDVDQTTMKHVARLQCFGQWVSEVQPGEKQPDDWSGEPTQGQYSPFGNRSGLQGLWGRLGQKRQDGDATITMGPDVILDVPAGRKLTHVKQEAQLAEQVLANDRYLKQLLTAQSIPPGEMMGEPARVSGIALQLERMGLTELRNDQVALYQQPTEELMNVLRLVNDAHQPDNSTRFGPLVPKFSADVIDIPIDPAVQNATDLFELQNGLASVPEKIAERRDISLAAATAIAAQIRGEPPQPKPGATPAATTPNSEASRGDETEPAEVQSATSATVGDDATQSMGDPATGTY